MLSPSRAGWQSGHAADCNSVNAGSIPTPASIFITSTLSRPAFSLQCQWCPDTSQPKSRALNRHKNLSAHFTQREISPITRNGYFFGLSPTRSEGQAARRYWVMDHSVITAAK